MASIAICFKKEAIKLPETLFLVHFQVPKVILEERLGSKAQPDLFF